MKLFLIVLIFAIGIVAFAFLGIAVKMLFKKKGEFKKSCSSVNPVTGERIGCVCGKTVFDKCENDPQYKPLDINSEILKEL